ncbi:MAG: hypothetical protein M1816_005741 [Peltula sp. TS41687]|nr:MAG: hypothetical protein M1816_005741 [Peltula sp. TS41687]
MEQEAARITPGKLQHIEAVYLYPHVPESAQDRQNTTTSADLLDLRHVETAWREGVPDTAGGLYVGYDIIDNRPSTFEATSGYAVAAKPEAEFTRSMGCLGLRVKLNDGVEAITTVTHGLVNLPQHGLVVRVTNWFLKAKEALLRFRTPAHVKISRATGNSPLGKTVWLALTNQKVGTIEYTYDTPSPHLPFPAGYQHDLSLVTDKELPWVTSPPGVATINGWAQYDEALDGCPLFITVFNVYKNKWETKVGNAVSQATQKAIAEGVEYRWEKETFSQSAAILWRLEKEDWRDVRGFSGGVLCVGNPTDQFAKALVFQNFETPIKAWQVRGGDSVLVGTWGCTLKGGFVLPQEIRESQIQSGEAEKVKNWASVSCRERTSTETGRRYYSGHL